MKTILFANRNTKEILRDAINLFFALAFPLVLLGLLSIINNAIPPEANNTIFEIENLAPGITMFGTTFLALFSGMLLAKDRTSSFLMRLFTSPMRAVDFILGYTMPMLAITFLQAAITLLAACVVGLAFSINLLLAILVTMLTSFLFIGIGLLCGSAMNDKAVGGVCGSLLTILAGFLSGIFMPIELIGGVIKTAADILPFYHCVGAIKAALNGNYADIPLHLAIVLAYTLVFFTLAIILFRRKMTNGKT